ncbi:MAG: hypothetical protein JWM14_844 [Chitinophagaceae bacterium]|nr:hypothetical protein [Chitinophagaceae bacterium]
MLKALDLYYEQQEEPTKGCLLALRHYLINFETPFTEALKYGMPFFLYNGKMFCYLWTDKKTKQPYIGIVDGNKIEHPLLVQDKRARMKVLYIDPAKDIPVKTIQQILRLAVKLRKV